jgi:hypothetical protein
VVNAAVDAATLFLGEGNGDGVANPGESIVILVKDGGKYYRANLYTSDPLINPNGVSIRLSDSWASYDYIGGSAKYTIPVISSDCPNGHPIDFFADYWVPNQIDHIIKKGNIKINVTGTDITPPVMQWMEVTADNIIQARVYDGTTIQQVKARFTPDSKASKHQYVDWEEPEKGFVVELTDNGQNGDRKAGDFIFTRAIYGQPSYFYKVTLEMTDALGNKKTEDYPDPIFLKHTR